MIDAWPAAILPPQNEPVETIFISEQELWSPLNASRRYDCQWMADPTFRAWLVWQRRQGKLL